MSIDRIGKPPGVPLSTSTPEVEGGNRAKGQTFQVLQPPAVEKVATAPVDQLQRGEITLEQYLDARVADATSHLEGKLSPDQLEFVRQSLRGELQTDPVLIELVRRGVGP